MRGVLKVGMVVAVVALVAVPAAGAKGIRTKVHFQGVENFGRHGGGTALVGRLHARRKACVQHRRRVRLFDAKSHRRLGTWRGRYGRWAVYARIEKGDRLFVKVSRARVRVKGRRVVCRAVKSKTYRVRRIVPGGQG